MCIRTQLSIDPHSCRGSGVAAGVARKEIFARGAARAATLCTLPAVAQSRQPLARPTDRPETRGNSQDTFEICRTSTRRRFACQGLPLHPPRRSFRAVGLWRAAIERFLAGVGFPATAVLPFGAAVSPTHRSCPAPLHELRRLLVATARRGRNGMEPADDRRQPPSV